MAALDPGRRHLAFVPCSELGARSIAIGHNICFAPVVGMAGASLFSAPKNSYNFQKSVSLMEPEGLDWERHRCRVVAKIDTIAQIL